MIGLVQSQRLAKEFADALGLQNVRRLVLTFDVAGLPTVEATFFAEEGSLELMPLLVKRYILTELPADAEVVVCDRDCPNLRASWPSCCKLPPPASSQSPEGVGL